MAPGKRGAVPQKNGHHLTREELLNEMRERRETYTLPGGGQITLRSIDIKSGVEYFGTVASDSQAIADRTKKICLMGIVEPQLEPEDLEALDKGRFGAVNQIATKIMELTGMTGEAATNFLTPIPTSKA